MANERHVDGIISVCRAGYQDVSKGLLSDSYIEARCKAFYNADRVKKEVSHSGPSWGGYFVAIENDEVVGAGGGGMTDEKTSWLYVLYLNPLRRNEGIGTKLLQAITDQQIEYGAKEQHVTVQKGNMKGIPFYEARNFIFQKEIQSKDIKEEPRAVDLEYRREL